MLNLYVVICAGSFSRHAVDVHSLCEYNHLYDKDPWTNHLLDEAFYRSGTIQGGHDAAPGPRSQSRQLVFNGGLLRLLAVVRVALGSFRNQRLAR